MIFSVHKENIVKYYIIFLPSLLIYTKLGERTYQDIIFIALVIYAFYKKEYVISKLVFSIWASWLFYALWSFYTDYLGSGGFTKEWFIHGELMLLLPILLSWVYSSDFKEWLDKGFRLALVFGGIVSLYQVFVSGVARAHGQENALVFAACISVYGLFVVHESIIRHGRSAGMWVVLTFAIVALSGSLGVVFSLFIALTVLSFFMSKKEILKSLIIPLTFILFISFAILSGQSSKKQNVYSSKYVTLTNALDRTITDFIKGDFVEIKHLSKNGTGSVVDESSSGRLKEKYRSSFGYRIVFLRGGWEVFLKNPITGVGSKFDTLYVGRSLGIGSHLTRFSHVHNAFLQDMVTGGIIKLISLILVIFLPVVCLLRMGKKKEFSLLFVISINYIVFGMTNMLFQLTTINIINTLIIAYVFSSLKQDVYIKHFRLFSRICG